MRTGRPPRPLIERFFEKFIIGNKDECWEWGAACNQQGYGQIKRRDGLHQRAHRVSWEFYFGAIPYGKMVCHSCDNPRCVNPNHLFLGTAQDNMDDMKNKNRKARLRGTKNGASKLTEMDVLNIRNDNRVQHIIAKDYGVCQMTISLIKNKKRWGYLVK